MHPLDHPVWNALTSSQRTLAEGGTLARRYPAAIAPFAAMTDMSAQSFAALGALMTASDQAVLFTPEPVTAPAEFKVLLAATGEQMIGTPAEIGARTADIVTLGPDDAPAMVELTKLTKPGPLYAENPRTGNVSWHQDRWAAGGDGGRANEARQLHRDNGGLRASCLPRPRLRANTARGGVPPDSGARRDSVPARIFR
jgi:hypothetical protein